MSMLLQEKEELKGCLFSRPDHQKLVDIKFFRGDNDTISPEDLSAQVCSIARQRQAGLKPAAGPTRSNTPVTDARKFVAKL
ncbi:hypothetical protein ACVMHY_006012 [Bradyrhizobium barranii subsp. barranii]